MSSELPLSLEQVRSEFSLWRRHHGGRGKPLPHALWALAVSLACKHGVPETARSLRLDKDRLSRRVLLAQRSASAGHLPTTPFVELSASEVLAPSPPVTIEVLGPTGERLRLLLPSTSTEQLVALVRAFAGREP